MTLKVPHVGWNNLAVPRTTRLLDGIAAGTQVYFTHSYAAPVVGATAATTTYGVTFSAAVEERAGRRACSFIRRSRATWGSGYLRNWIDAF